MVNKLLDYSSLEGGKLQIKFRPVKLGAVTRDLATLFRDAVERGGLQFIVNCDDDPPDTQAMYVAMDLWEKVIYNIVGVNSLSFLLVSQLLDSNGSPPRRTPSSTAIADPSRLPSAPPSPKLCSPFATLESESTPTTALASLSALLESKEHLGLRAELVSVSSAVKKLVWRKLAKADLAASPGLAYTLEIVKLLGGQLEVESEPGQGSTFMYVIVLFFAKRLLIDSLPIASGFLEDSPIFPSRKSCTNPRRKLRCLCQQVVASP